MRIAFVSTYPPIECGIGTYTQFLTESLRFHQKEVHVISQHGARGRNVHAVYDPNSNSIAKDIFLIAARISPDVVHIEHEFGLFGDQRGVQVMELVMRLKMAHIPCAITLHTVNENLPEDEAILLKNLVRTCDITIVHENYQKEIIKNKFNEFKKVNVISHGIRNIEPVKDAKKIVGVEGKRVILLAGFFRKTKNFDRVVRLFPKIVARLPDACLLIAGKLRGIEYSDYQKKFFESINQSPAKKNILVLRGQFPQKTFDTILSSADIMAFPYIAGAQSGVMAHSAALKIPLITSDLKSFKLWNVKCKGGITAKTDKEFVDGTVKLLMDQNFYKNCVKNIDKFIKPILWEKISIKHIKLYEKIIKVPYGNASYFYVPEN